MQYVKIGSSELEVSRMALGLGFRGQSSASEAERLIGHAIDSGINFIDCANKYQLRTDAADAHGSSEEILGRVLATRRDQLVITSKVGAEGGPENEAGGCSRENILREVERSLSRLGTDYIDLYFLHRFDPVTPMEETLRVLDDLVTSGKVRYIGCSNYQAWQVCKALWLSERMQAAPFVCVQNNYNLLNRHLEREMFPLVRDQGLGLMAFSPLQVGLLSGIYVHGEPPPPGSLWSERREEFEAVFWGETAAVVETARDVAEQRGVSMPQLAVNWVRARDEVSVVITGSDSVEQFDDNRAAFDWELSEEELARLNERFVEMMVW
ncbi:MAG: aldo/keto reductase [Planctomycetaceae bacterium]|jgi:aryl-alcohol dehydrogenase-like predicted oxidoreductase|nr:aldo/keto reductase [Planctomycetaceae bacterium]MDP7275751.1 aldo/keto reductase [Planctomycetaceae bacterium]